jgi:hypothetical protein
MGKSETYEIESLLHQIDEEGFVVIQRARLLRLLGKGNEAAGTWRALLDAWEGIDGNRRALRITQIRPGVFLLTKQGADRVASWAGEERAAAA